MKTNTTEILGGKLNKVFDIEYSNNDYSVPKWGGTPYGQVPEEDIPAIAELDDAGKLIDFDIKVVMAAAQNYANGYSTAANLTALFMMALLDRVVESSHFFANLDAFRLFLKNFKISKE